MSARSLNKVLLIGNLTRDPEIRYTSSGAAVCSFGMATNRSWKDAEGEIREEAEFHNLVSWNKMAEVCYQILAKGMKVYIEGELRTRSWDDESGNTRYRTEIKLNEMILLDSKGKHGAGDAGSSGGEITVDDVMGESGGKADKAVKEEDKDEEKDEDGEKKPKKEKKALKISDKPSEKPKDGEQEDPLEDDVELPF